MDDVNEQIEMHANRRHQRLGLKQPDGCWSVPTWRSIIPRFQTATPTWTKLADSSPRHLGSLISNISHPLRSYFWLIAAFGGCLGASLA